LFRHAHVLVISGSLQHGSRPAGSRTATPGLEESLVHYRRTAIRVGEPCKLYTVMLASLRILSPTGCWTELGHHTRSIRPLQGCCASGNESRGIGVGRQQRLSLHHCPGATLEAPVLAKSYFPRAHIMCPSQLRMFSFHAFMSHSFETSGVRRLGARSGWYPSLSWSCAAFFNCQWHPRPLEFRRLSDDRPS
jgi:hypothetical protein